MLPIETCNMVFTVALAEDNRVNRNTFLQKIKGYPEIELVFESENGNDFLEQLQGLPHHKLPQVVFMDLEMPDMDGVAAIRIGKTLFPQIHFIVLTVFDDDEKIFEAIRAGASGYLLKHESAAVLKESIESVIESGGAPMSPPIARKALQLLSISNSPSPKANAAANETLPETVTEREFEILKHTVNGWDAKRIASALDLSVLTVRKHIANIYQKLHVNSKAQIITLAHKNKWV
jgi:DNA-binding NarL/FixJ family response regulator